MNEIAFNEFMQQLVAWASAKSDEEIDRLTDAMLAGASQDDLKKIEAEFAAKKN